MTRTAARANRRAARLLAIDNLTRLTASLQPPEHFPLEAKAAYRNQLLVALHVLEKMLSRARPRAYAHSKTARALNALGLEADSEG